MAEFQANLELLQTLIAVSVPLIWLTEECGQVGPPRPGSLSFKLDHTY